MFFPEIFPQDFSLCLRMQNFTFVKVVFGYFPARFHSVSKNGNVLCFFPFFPGDEEKENVFHLEEFTPGSGEKVAAGKGSKSTRPKINLCVYRIRNVRLNLAFVDLSSLLQRLLRYFSSIVQYPVPVH